MKGGDSIQTGRGKCIKGEAGVDKKFKCWK